MHRMLSAAVALCAAFLFVFATGTAFADTVVVDAVDSPTSSWRPAQVTVKTGDTVQWQFDEATQPHNVQSTSANWSYSTPIASGQAPVSFTFDEPGVYTYVCTAHTSTMTGSVTVEDEAAPELENVLVFSETAGFRHDVDRRGHRRDRGPRHRQRLQRRRDRGRHAVQRRQPRAVRRGRLALHDR